MFTGTEIKLHTDTVSILQSRLYINQLIRRIMDVPPDRENFMEIAEDPRFHYLCEISHSCQTIQEGITTYLLGEGNTVNSVREEYTRLFIGPGNLPAPLWESVYLSREHIMFDEQTIQVRECYRKHGLSFVRENNEPDDHIVTELEFLSYLILQTLLSTDHASKSFYMDEQLSFLQEHLLVWGPLLCERLSEAAENDLFKGVSQLLMEYLELEIELTSQLKEELAYE
ncbi:TorD/DmsD family molecular chaperone [Bacillus marasmi]|uniref:TorD/DmsD family molecular chaperone n=1 Tax=Bacillus marasmi TaxID=1926279 RepID=UPI00164E7ED2|nr:molecular chaperone TorD family protein [Bacillus marasmi]